MKAEIPYFCPIHKAGKKELFDYIDIFHKKCSYCYVLKKAILSKKIIKFTYGYLKKYFKNVSFTQLWELMG